MSVLVVNAGSSSTKLALVEGAKGALASTEARTLGSPDDEAVGDAVVEWCARPGVRATAHRLVHGGRRFTAATVIDDAVRAEMGRLAELAPLHNPPALALLDRARAGTRLPAVACFDTGYFADLPAPAATFAIPECLRADLGIRRFGFHGLSHQWCARRVAALLGRPLASLRVVSAHLGSGASLAAIRGGVAVDTTMGFTPVDGLVMGTRPGSLDPGALAYLLRHHPLSSDELDDLLERRCGLLALAGSSDLRVVLARADAGDTRAILARDVYLHRLAAGVAAMAAAMGGLDALAFTGGAGEHALAVRRATCETLGFLGIERGDDVSDEDVAGGDRLESTPTSAVAVAVIHAREDVVMTEEALALLDDEPLSARE